MGSHNEFSELYAAKAAGENHLVPPSDGSTIDLRGTDGSLVLYDTSSAITGKLPASTPFGVTVYVSNRSTGTITVQNPSAVTVDTVADGEIKGFVSAGDNTWNALGGVSGTQLASTAASLGANLVGFQDGGSKTAATTVDGALDEIYVSLTGTGRIGVPITCITEEDGTPLTVAGADSGFAQLANKNIVLQIPVNATTEAFAASVPVPSDFNKDADDEVVLNVTVSKSANADALTLDVELYALGADADNGWSADGYGGNAVAIADADIHTLQFAATAEWITGGLATANALAFVLTLGGTNDGDVTYIHNVYWTYRKKLLTS
jgi:hypothetical protein